jgi:DNA adenine methylase
MPRSYSPLRYPGGKSKLYNKIEYIIRSNNLINGLYVEPYAGGAGIACGLLFKDMVNSVVINDYDISIYAFWYSILYYTERFIELLWETPVTIEEWHAQKEIQKQKEAYSNDLLLLGFSTFFLNRTNRSGIVKGGVIGGIRQDGKYKLDCRYNKENLIKRILQIAKYRDKIELSNLKAEELITKRLVHLSEESFIFFDPPYYKKGPGLYTNFYDHKNHVELESLIHEHVHTPYVITYDNVNEIKDIYKMYSKLSFEINYSASKAKKGSEILIFKGGLLPKSSFNDIKRLFAV